MKEVVDYEHEKWEDIVSSTNELNFIASSEQFKQILSELGNKVDDEDFIVDTKTEAKAQSKDEGEIRLSELGGILTGSKVFIKKNVASFSEHLIEKKLRKQS